MKNLDRRQFASIQPRWGRHEVQSAGVDESRRPRAVSGPIQGGESFELRGRHGPGKPIPLSRVTAECFQGIPQAPGKQQDGGRHQNDHTDGPPERFVGATMDLVHGNADQDKGGVRLRTVTQRPDCLDPAYPVGPGKLLEGSLGRAVQIRRDGRRFSDGTALRGSRFPYRQRRRYTPVHRGLQLLHFVTRNAAKTANGHPVLQSK